ncbi:MAG: recombinase family protein [Stellaceae bacterium]
MLSAPPSTHRAVIYARVSTASQTEENQIIQLRETAKRYGWTIIAELRDHGISGTQNESARPGFQQLWEMVRKRKADVIMVWSIDRLSRSLTDLLRFVAEIQACGCDLFSLSQNIDTTTPSGKLCFSVFGALAEYENQLRRERIMAGLDRARREGKRLGRPSNVNSSVITSVKLLREKGHSIHNIAKSLHIGVGTTQKILRAA